MSNQGKVICYGDVNEIFSNQEKLTITYQTNMRKLSSFTFITLNGFYKDDNDDTGWHQHGEEGNKYSTEALKLDNILLFGRVTYDMMKSFWPTEQALNIFPDVAKGMNKSEKIVFSKTLKNADWNNTRVVKGNIVEEIKKLKKTEGKNMTILGSGNIVTQFAGAGLIDEYQIMLCPVIIGKGTPLFQGLKHPLNLKLTNTVKFKDGTNVLSYEPIKK